MKKTIFGRYFQYVAAFIAMSSYITMGALKDWAWPAAIPELVRNGTRISAPPEDLSWMPTLGFASLLINVPLLLAVNHLGRKKLLGLANVPLVASWLVVSCAGSTAAELAAARVLAGMGLAALASVAPVYLSEVVEDSARGAAVATSGLLLHLGELLRLCASPLLPFPTLAAAATLFPAAFLLLFTWIPDTPLFYLASGRRKRAEEALARLRGRQDNADELDALQCFVDLNRPSEGLSLWSALRTRSFRRAALICLGLGVAQVLGDVAPLRDYSQSLTDANLNRVVDPDFSSIVIHLVTVVGAALSCVLVDLAGRRPLMMASCSVCAVALVAEGAFFFSSSPSGSSWWLPLACHAVFRAFRALGLGPVPVLVCTEVFPAELRAPAFVASSFLAALLGQARRRFLPLALLACDPHAPLWATAAFLAASLVFVVFLLPETRSKSFLLINLEIDLSVKR